MSLCCVSEIIFLHLHPKAKNKHHSFLSKSKNDFPLTNYNIKSNGTLSDKLRMKPKDLLQWMERQGCIDLRMGKGEQTDFSNPPF